METVSHKSELEVLRDQQLARLREDTNRPERFTLDFACARHDRDFRVTFTRLPPASVFRCERVDKGDTKWTSVIGRLQGIFAMSEPMRLRSDEVDFSSVSCAWCGINSGWTRCGRCNVFVCDARSVQGTFSCRASCGARFETEPLKGLDAVRDAATGGQPAIGRTAQGRLAGSKRR
jgi:hypothetical protein